MLKISRLFKSQNLTYLILSIIVLTHAFILTKLIFFPYPELFIYPYLTNHGLKPYQQILDQHFPGLLFLPINLNNLGMTTPEMARVWSILIAAITQILIFFISRKFFKSNTKAILANCLYLVWQPFFEGWVLWIDTLLPPILLFAFCFLYLGEEKNWGGKWIFWSGIFLGLGVVFKQVLIPMAVLISVYLFWKNRSWKAVGIFLFGLSLPLGLMIFYLIWIGVFAHFWYWTVIFNLTVYAQLGRGMGPTLAHLSRATLVFGTAFVILRLIKEKEAQVLLLFLVGTLFGLLTRFDFVHFQPVLPFAILATLLGFGKLGRLVLVRVFGALYILVTIWWLAIFYKGHLGDRVIAFDSDAKNLAAKIRNYTTVEEKIFVFGAQPHLYQMSETLPAGDIFVFQFPWFYQVAKEQILEGLKQDQPNIVISDRTYEMEDQKIVEFAREIDQYINENYQKIDSVGEAAILRKKS